MIVPSDKDYKETKLIKQGKASLNPDFRSLADWINKKYDVTVLNIYYDICKGPHNKRTPRVNIIFEHEEDEQKFRDLPFGMYHSEKQKLVARKFDELVNGKSIIDSIPIFRIRKTKEYKYDVNDLFLTFHAFEPIAKDEANECVTQDEVNSLQSSLNNREIWEISRFASYTTFLFYTQKQAEAAKTNGYLQELASKYFEILKKYDEFNYFDKQAFSVRADSKENFDKNYESNWFYYYK